MDTCQVRNSPGIKECAFDPKRDREVERGQRVPPVVGSYPECVRGTLGVDVLTAFRYEILWSLRYSLYCLVLLLLLPAIVTEHLWTISM